MGNLTDLNCKCWGPSVFFWRVTCPFHTEFINVHKPVIQGAIVIDLVQGSIQNVLFSLQGTLVLYAVKHDIKIRDLVSETINNIKMSKIVQYYNVLKKNSFEF